MDISPRYRSKSSTHDIARSTNSQLRQSATILLGKIALSDSIPDLIELLKDPDPTVVQSAIVLRSS